MAVGGIDVLGLQGIPCRQTGSQEPSTPPSPQISTPPYSLKSHYLELHFTSAHYGPVSGAIAACSLTPKILPT